MTKEELAKKKGIKLPNKKETPAEALINNTADVDKNTPTKAKTAKKEEKNTSSRTNIKKPSSTSKKTPNSSKEKKKSVSKSAGTEETASNLSDVPVKKEPQKESTAASSHSSSRYNNNDSTMSTPAMETPSSTQSINEISRHGVGKPKKRKPGDKKLSLWINEDLVARMYNNLSYGDSAGALLNKALQEYLDNHDLY